MSGHGLDLVMEQLSDRDQAILTDLERFRLLTTRHVQRLHFADHATSQAATRACSRALLRLRELALVTPLERRIGGVRRGSASFVWQLAARGERLLRHQRGQAQRRRYLEPSLHFAKHTLAIADLAIGIIEATRETPRQTQQRHLEGLTTEPATWIQFIGPNGETRWLKPDLHVVTSAIDNEGVVEEHIYFEVDLGTEHRGRIIAKCALYAAHAATGAYQARHGLFPEVVWVSGDATRRRALRVAIEGHHQLPQELFRVTSPERYITELRRVEP